MFNNFLAAVKNKDKNSFPVKREVLINNLNIIFSRSNSDDEKSSLRASRSVIYLSNSLKVKVQLQLVFRRCVIELKRMSAF